MHEVLNQADGLGRTERFFQGGRIGEERVGQTLEIRFTLGAFLQPLSHDGVVAQHPVQQVLGHNRGAKGGTGPRLPADGIARSFLALGAKLGGRWAPVRDGRAVADAMEEGLGADGDAFFFFPELFTAAWRTGAGIAVLVAGKRERTLGASL